MSLTEAEISDKWIAAVSAIIKETHKDNFAAFIRDCYDDPALNTVSNVNGDRTSLKKWLNREKNLIPLRLRVTLLKIKKSVVSDLPVGKEKSENKDPENDSDSESIVGVIERLHKLDFNTSCCYVYVYLPFALDSRVIDSLKRFVGGVMYVGEGTEVRASRVGRAYDADHLKQSYLNNPLFNDREKPMYQCFIPFKNLTKLQGEVIEAKLLHTLLLDHSKHEECGSRRSAEHICQNEWTRDCLANRQAETDKESQLPEGDVFKGKSGKDILQSIVNMFYIAEGHRLV